MLAGTGAAADEGSTAELQLVLPDLSEERWVYNGTHNVKGQPAAKYTWALPIDHGFGKVP